MNTQAAFVLAEIGGDNIDGILGYRWLGCRKIMIDPDTDSLMFKLGWETTNLVRMFATEMPPPMVFQVFGTQHNVWERTPV